MADQTQLQVSATFPNPPEFLWRDFTADKVARFEELKKAWQDASPSAAAASESLRIPDLPQDLAHLQPPPEPVDGNWRSHGGYYTLKDELPTLEESGIQRLQPNGETSSSLSPPDSNRDRALNLKRLAKSALLNFLELVGVASINPDGIAEKADDIETILINMHNSINEYRPHQARESLIQTMQDRLDQIRAETAAVNAVTDKAKRVLEGLGSIDAPGVGQADVKEQEAVKNGFEVPGSSADDDEIWAEAATFA